MYEEVIDHIFEIGAELNALKNVAVMKVNKVTLELGIKVGGKMGISFVTE